MQLSCDIDSRVPLLTSHIIVNIIHRPLVHLIGCIKLASSAKAHDSRTSSVIITTVQYSADHVPRDRLRGRASKSCMKIQQSIPRTHSFQSTYIVLLAHPNRLTATMQCAYTTIPLMVFLSSVSRHVNCVA